MIKKRWVYWIRCCLCNKVKLLEHDEDLAHSTFMTRILQSWHPNGKYIDCSFCGSDILTKHELLGIEKEN
jgi:hypothetical protein